MSVAVSAALVLLLSGAQPDQYTERSLCDLWAGAQCHATSCLNDAQERCAASSRRCRTATRASVPPERAERVAECARVLLQNGCGAPEPEICAGLSPF